jgi:hypothetical protein
MPKLIRVKQIDTKSKTYAVSSVYRIKIDVDASGFIQVTIYRFHGKGQQSVRSYHPVSHASLQRVLLCIPTFVKGD